MAKYPWYLSNLVAFIRLNLFVKIELQKWLNNPFEEPKTTTINLCPEGLTLKNTKKQTK